MFRLEWLFFMQLAMGVLMIVFLQKLTQMKKQVDEITKEVSDYIFYITEDMEEATPEYSFVKNECQKEDTAEAQNSLIQAVLGEYFS